MEKFNSGTLRVLNKVYIINLYSLNKNILHSKLHEGRDNESLIYQCLPRAWHILININQYFTDGWKSVTWVRLTGF